jgi:hypothetical protein
MAPAGHGASRSWRERRRTEFWHSYLFRLSDGKAVNCPGYRLRVFDVKEENGALFVRPAG